MRYSPKQYAKALFELIQNAHKDERLKHMKEFSSILQKNGDLKHGDEIVYQLGILIEEKDGGPKVKIEEEKHGGMKARIGDMLVDNTLTHRLNQLKKAIAQ